MSTTSKRRKCCNDPDIFCYICGCSTLPPQRRNINSFVKRIYHACFGVPLGEQDKSLVPHRVCLTCAETLRSWSQGKNAKLKSAVPVVWRESTNHVEDCYFGLVNIKGFNKKNNQHFQYPNIQSAMRPIPNSDEVPVTTFTKFRDIDEDQLRSSTFLSNSDDDEKQDIVTRHGMLTEFLCIVSLN